MNAQVKRALLPILRDVKAGKPPTFRQRSAAEWILHKLKKPSPLRNRPSAQRKEAKAAQHREETDAIRQAVRERAAGVCEACGKRWGFWGWSMDHWLGGWGRRRPKQSVETCWALCGSGTTGCHGRRQTNDPSAAVWNERFRLHCEKHGYPFQPHIEHADLPRKTAP